MSLFISSLNSGSNGNCYYVGNNKEAILIDAGISCREIEKRIIRLGLSLRNIKALFISHEHTDHVKGVYQISKKYNLPVYITKQTLSRCNFSIAEELTYTFNTIETISIGQLTVKAFKKVHDAVHPHSFIVENYGTTVGVFTDLGRVCDDLVENFKKCHAAFLESNYCEDLLENGNYPYFLKNRIRGGKGHLSNNEALNLFKNHRSNNLDLLILSHLSHNNNCPDLVNKLFTENARSTKIVVASRLQETPLYEVSNPSISAAPHSLLYEQTSLF